MIDNSLKIDNYLSNSSDILSGKVKEHSLLYLLLVVFSLAEMAVNERKGQPWLIEEKLNKRRGAYEFDKHLQNMMLSANNKNSIIAHCIECGNSSLYKTEMIFHNEFYVHFNHSFNSNAKYSQKYLHMNCDFELAKFAYFCYGLNNEKNKITSLKFIIPHSQNKNEDMLCDLTTSLEQVKGNVIRHSDSVEKSLKEIQWGLFVDHRG